MIDFVFVGGWVTVREVWKGGVLYSSVWNWSTYQNSPLLRNPSWEANASSPTREIFRILWNPKIHYRVRRVPTNTLCARCLFSTHQFPDPSQSSPLDHRNKIWWGIQIMNILQYPVTSSFLNSLRL